MVSQYRNRRTRQLKSILREPLFHFLVLGSLVFILFQTFGDPSGPPVADTLEISENDAARLIQQFEATWRRKPTPDELESLIDRLVEEEVYVREARALGLDRGDAIVRQRLAQKMGFLLESGSEAAVADDATLQAHLERFPERFTEQSVIGFEQVSLPDGPSDPQVLLDALRGGARPEELGAASLLPPTIPPSPKSVIDGTFGVGFFDAVSELEPGEWGGPVESAYGPHAVRLTAIAPARLPSLAEIRSVVERDWREEIRAELSKARLDALLSRYEIIRPDSAAALQP